jgi:hypothetical protein
MAILPSQLLKDFSLMILTNFFPLWNETALRARAGGQGGFIQRKKKLY